MRKKFSADDWPKAICLNQIKNSAKFFRNGHTVGTIGGEGGTEEIQNWIAKMLLTGLHRTFIQV